MFLIAMSTIGIKSGVFPRRFAQLGYVVSVVLHLVVAFYDWIILVLPAWVALVSAYILRRERSRGGRAAPATSGS